MTSVSEDEKWAGTNVSVRDSDEIRLIVTNESFARSQRRFEDAIGIRQVETLTPNRGRASLGVAAGFGGEM